MDIVIHKLFGDPKHESVLINFLNAVLAWPVPIVRARVLNPFTPDLYKGQRGLILDIRAEDELGRIYEPAVKTPNTASLWITPCYYAAQINAQFS